MGIGFQWVYPVDYHPLRDYVDLDAGCPPIRRQLLGETKTVAGVYLPTDEDVPLRAQHRAWFDQS